MLVTLKETVRICGLITLGAVISALIAVIAMGEPLWMAFYAHIGMMAVGIVVVWYFPNSKFAEQLFLSMIAVGLGANIFIVIVSAIIRVFFYDSVDDISFVEFLMNHWNFKPLYQQLIYCMLNFLFIFGFLHFKKRRSEVLSESMSTSA